MNLHLTGHQLPITPAIREYVAAKLERLAHHFDNVIDVNVIMSVDKLRQLARGETPFLHVMRSNEAAHQLYLRMGFEDYLESVVRVVELVR